MKTFSQKLDDLKARGRYRSVSADARGVDLTSNDYLGFAKHPALREAGARFFADGGAAGACASRLLRGEMEAHHALEEYAAGYFGAPRTLFFSSGFMANTALMTALPQRGDVIIFDSLIHASSRDGIQASRARHIRVAHNDLEAYEAALAKVRADSAEQIWVAVESVYSMDGDAAPLDGLYDLCERYDAYLIIDEAHGVGVCGATGKGLSETLLSSLRAHAKQSRAAKLDCCVAGAPRNDGWPENLIVVHTCGKALGVAGGLVCASREVVEYLVNAARGFIYSTAPMPVQAHLVQAALALLAREEGQARRANLKRVCAQAKELLGGHGSHILPVVIGEDERAVEVATAMQRAGYDVRAIRPPTVPQGTARLRVSLNAELREKDLQGFAAALSSVMKSEAA